MCRPQNVSSKYIAKSKIQNLSIDVQSRPYIYSSLMASSLPCGCGGVPFVSIIFRHFTNVGFGFSKTFGFLVISYISFLRVTFKIVPFKEGFLYTLLLAYLLINLAIFIKNKKEITGLLQKNLGFIIFRRSYSLPDFSVLLTYPSLLP
ncbi:hypothetical protein A2686_04405 [Candidatus Woesebacteria bacterium RIFCSPHIGHO2_01_FULL_38_10]|uniref:Uncharacterized protein n=1 Tax=Candidatus Woesebacteria bacterium RIFCSPLOWO2_01_FULL_39_10b TaxID=1802517 RepID=A0A1F8B9Z4_9BACT|nr:MAG: hypothetical protein A2686_04405 [Candidatus Woesebacteria bacterium RIFCSPHIGHO2_01_FULL_38_10]OGM60853.1 MAG: hypothetical protein A2892_04330 [Candidatus Woesebacteria bacterium RIFCSPLOWO2_01_FULL_39_10b]